MNPYGFDWGPMSVERLAHIEGRGYVLNIKTEHVEMQVHVTEKGRKITPYPTRDRTPNRTASDAEPYETAG